MAGGIVDGSYGHRSGGGGGLTPAQLAKLNSIQAGAQVNPHNELKFSDAWRRPITETQQQREFAGFGYWLV